MISAWIVVREEKHIDDKYWICLDRDDALLIARNVIDYWKEEYDVNDEDDEVDRECYGAQVLHYDVEDAFRVFVEPVVIRSNGETEKVDLED